MEITWHKDTCFRIKGKKTSIVVNPTETSGKLKGDLVLSSVGENLSEVDGMHKLFDWPGEYESKSVPVNGFQAWTKSKAKDSTSIFGKRSWQTKIIWRRNRLIPKSEIENENTAVGTKKGN